MTATFIQIPFPVFFDSNGDPLDNGYVYVGLPQENPITNPIQVYFDADLTQPAAQPLRTIRGRIDSGGSPANIYGNLTLPSAYSMTVLNKNQELVFSVPQGTGFDSVLGNLAVVDGNTLTTSNTDGDIILDPNGAGDVIIDTNLGIGIDPPTAPLQVQAPASGGGSIVTHTVFGRGTDNVGYMATVRDAVLNDVKALVWGVGTNGTSEKMRLQDDGKLGLGVTPTELLHIQDTTNIPYVQITGADTAFAALALGGTTTPKSSLIRHDNVNDILQLVTNSSTRLSITNTGKIGINAAIPDSLLHIQNNDTTAFDATNADGQEDNGTTIKISNTPVGDNVFGQILFKLDNNSTIGRIVCGTEVSAGNSYLSFVTESGGSPDQRLKIDKDGLFTLNDDTIGFDTFTDDDTFGTVSGTTLASSESIKTYIQNQITNAGIPTGVIWDWAGTSATVPAGWLLCDGSLLDQTTYAALFAAIGTTYNTGGESASQFRIPDFRGRVSSGVDASGSPGQTFGSDSITLTTAQLPAHNHPISNITIQGLNASTQGSSNVGSGLQYVSSSQWANPTITATTSATANSTTTSHSATSATVGSGSAIDIRQPSMKMYKIIKT